MHIVCNCPNVCVVFLIEYKLHLILVYRPPSNSVTDNDLLIDFLLDFCADKEVIIFGDFNLPDIDWRCESCLSANYSPLYSLLC